MPDYARARWEAQGQHRGETLADWLSRGRASDPSFQLPSSAVDFHTGRGQRYDADMNVLPQPTSWMEKYWLPLMLATVSGGTLGGLAAGGSFAGMGAGAGTAASASAPGVTTGLTAVPGATVPIGGAAAAGTAGGTMAGIKSAMEFAPYVTAGINALRRTGPTDDEQAMGDTQRQLQQMQLSRIQQSDPLYQAILQLAMSLMPVNARRGLPIPGQAQPRRGY